MLTTRFVDACALASALHTKQLRKLTSIPYVAHLMSVAALVLEHGGAEDEAIAALLHDAIEDQGGPGARDMIRLRSGDAVVEIVDGCTDAETIPKPPWKERKEAYIAHLATASPSVRLVSAAGKLHNARAILFDYRNLKDDLWGRFNVGGAETLWYYRALVDAFQTVESTSLVEELARTAEELERLVTFQSSAES